jgi:formylglycine-generating enzyme required for sulfatase activity
VFISYSHDSRAHRDWVRQLAEQLRAKGVDVILDQWDLRPGADVVRFMEQGIVAAERVLMVCTANYVAKAEERKGGAGFEGMIVTGQVAQATETIKFVPIVRDNPRARIPAFLGQRLWLDFRDDGRFDEILLELLHDLHEVPRYVKPPLGPNPFAPTFRTPTKAPDPDPDQPASTPLPPPPAATPPLRSLASTTAQLRQEGSQWLLERQELTVKGFEQELGGGVSLLLVEIPAGRFLMGSPPGEPGRDSDEGPQHEVELASFFMGQAPITQAQWRAVARWQPPEGRWWERELDPEPSRFQPESAAKQTRYIRLGTFALLEGEESTDQRPVEQVSWGDAMEFCQRLNSRLGAGAGRTYTLPSESQWEYACRAGTATPFAFGETLTAELANYDASETYGNGPKGKVREQTTPVGMFPANAWGLHDMHGNVWEWCLDHWHENYEGAPEDGSAWCIDESALDRGKGEGMRRKGRESGGEGKETGVGMRLLRGGSWYYPPGICRSAYRSHYAPHDANDLVGFRVVCLPQGPSLNT